MPKGNAGKQSPYFLWGGNSLLSKYIIEGFKGGLIPPLNFLKKHIYSNKALNHSNEI